MSRSPRSPGRAVLAAALLSSTLALAAPPRAPTRHELFRTLLAHASLPLRDASCKDVVPGVARPTLGDWIAYNLSVLERGQVSLPTRCEREASGWRCEVEFSVRDPKQELFWRWGVRFKLRADRGLLPASLVCTGAG